MNWFLINPLHFMAIIISTVGMLTAIIVFTRLNGLRTLSKMSSYDFVVTVAFGSVIASTILTPRPSLFEGVVALGTLILCQFVISFLRRHQNAGELVDNAPVILMQGGTFFEDVLSETRVTKNDIYAKLREANVFDVSHVHAVVLETTGDVSVLHGQNQTLHQDILTGVSNVNKLSSEA
jgi:uncharacterized membrane protein YcaP (DUF421 family)